MSEADELARRFFGLWAEYLTALAADPQAAEPVRQWLALAAGVVVGGGAGDAGGAAFRSPVDAAAAAGASGERAPALAQLARRVDELGERVAALERAATKQSGGSGKPAAGRTRRRPRAAGS